MQSMTYRGAGAVAALMTAGLAHARPTPPAWPNQHSNNIDLYGRLDQKDVGGTNGSLGRWACGPTSLVNSMHYLQMRFADHYTGMDVAPGNYPIPDEPQPPAMMPNGMIDREEMIKTVERLAAPAYMNEKKGRPVGMDEDPYEYRRTDSPGMPGDDRPADPNAPGGGVAGGVTWQRFAYGKDRWLTRPGMPETVMGGQFVNPWVPADLDPNEQPDPDDLDDPRGFPKPAWLQAGVQLDMNKMFDTLWRGADVEVGFTWSGGFGGHFVTVIGYEFTTDSNGNKVFDNGDAAVLYAIDPWAEVADAGIAPLVPINIMRNNLTGAIDLDYIGGAAGMGASGTMKIWCSEIPGPGGASLLIIGGVAACRRRRR